MTRWVPPPPIERYEDPPPAILPTVGVATPMVALPPSLERVVVMTRGNGGRIIDHRMTYEGYFRAGTKVESQRAHGARNVAVLLELTATNPAVDHPRCS
jgi:hypothetical protein